MSDSNLLGTASVSSLGGDSFLIPSSSATAGLTGGVGAGSIGAVGHSTGHAVGHAVGHNGQPAQMMPVLPDVVASTMDEVPDAVPMPWVADTPGQIRSAAQDFDADGQADLFWRDPLTGNAALRLMNPDLTIRDDIELNPPIRDGNWTIAGTGNFNGDVFADVLWHNRATGQVVAWFMNNGQPTGAGPLPPETDRAWQIRGVGNFDGDLQADDLLWYNPTTGARRVWLMNGTARSQVVDIQPQDTAPGELLGVGDLDRNGTSDLIWRDASGNIPVWLMDGTQRVGISSITASQGSTVVPTRSTDFVLSAVADFSGDGQIDLLWQRPASGQQAGTLSLWTLNNLELVSENNVAEFADPVFVDPADGFDIQFDYSFDSVGWFTAEKRAALEAAADVWEQALLDDFEDTPVGTATPFLRHPETNEDITTAGQDEGIFLTQEPIDDIVIFVGTQALGVEGSLGLAGSSGFFTNESRYNGPDFEPWAGSLTMNRDANWFFDPTPSTDDDIPFNQSDFISTAVHEIGHILGFSGSVSAFAEFVNPSGDRFIGPNALARTSNQGIPLEEDDSSHIEDGFEGNGSGETALDPISFTGGRQLPTIFDLAIFDDIGYDVDYSRAAQNESAAG